jgi:hypothetical protein
MVEEINRNTSCKEKKKKKVEKKTSERRKTNKNKEEILTYTQCNQDELGTRKAVEQSVSNHFRDRKNVIVDRCNFDIVQRHTWVKLASMFGVKWYVKNYIYEYITNIYFDMKIVILLELFSRAMHKT